MNREKLEKIKRDIAAAKRKANTYRDLERIALSLKRKLARGAQSRGKEPAFISKAFPNANPITIPNHAGKTIPKGTAHSILRQLEEDIFRFEEALHKEVNETNDTEGNGYDNGNSYTH